MKKSKVLVVVLFILVSLIGLIGIIFFSNKNEKLIEENESLKTQNKELIVRMNQEEMKYVAEKTVKDSEKVKMKPIEEKLSDFYDKLTIEQRVGQLFIFGHNDDKIDERAISLIKDRFIGGFCFYRRNASSIEQLYGMIMLMQQMAISEIENGIPLFIAGDNEPGKRWSSMSHLIEPIPVADEIAKNYTVEEAGVLFRKLAEELRYLGYNIDFAPVVDVNTNKANPIIGERSFSDNPDTVSLYSTEFIKQFRDVGLITSAKHFLGHGDTSLDSHKKLPRVTHSIDRLNSIELMPFKNAIKNNVDMIMTAHIVFEAFDPENPSTLSKRILTDLLRTELKYDGIIITDDMFMGAILSNYDIKDAAILAINSGVDIVLSTQIQDKLPKQEDLYDAVLNAVKEGTISEEKLKESVLRILKLKSTNPIIQSIWGSKNPINNY